MTSSPSAQAPLVAPPLDHPSVGTPTLAWLIHDVPHLPPSKSLPFPSKELYTCHSAISLTMTKSQHWFPHLVSRINQVSSDPSLGQSMFIHKKGKGLFFHQTKDTRIITDSFPMHCVTGSLHSSTKIRISATLCHFTSPVFPFRMTGPSWDAPHHTRHGLDHCETSGHVSWRE